MEKNINDSATVENQDKPKFKIKQSPIIDELSPDGAKTVKPQSPHDKLVIIQAINYKKQGYTNIKVNNTNYLLGLPEEVGGFTPDLTAVYNATTTICEVETSDSINDSNTIQKWKEFDRSGYKFHLIIPNKAFKDVKEIMKNNGITVDKYWCSGNY